MSITKYELQNLNTPNTLGTCKFTVNIRNGLILHSIIYNVVIVVIISGSRSGIEPCQKTFCIKTRWHSEFHWYLPQINNILTNSLLSYIGMLNFADFYHDNCYEQFTYLSHQGFKSWLQLNVWNSIRKYGIESTTTKYHFLKPRIYKNIIVHLNRFDKIFQINACGILKPLYNIEIWDCVKWLLYIPGWGE